jgi:Transposase, Mutator family
VAPRADQLRPKVPKLAALMDEAEDDVLAYMTFPQQHRAKLHSKDVIDTTSFSSGAIFPCAGDLVAKSGRLGWKRRRAA